MKWACLAAAIVVCALLTCVAGCQDGRGGGGGPAATTTAGVASATTPAVSGVAALASAVESRKRDYLQFAAGGDNYYAQLARLELGQPIDRAPLDAMLDFVDSRQDTADFKTTALLRLVHLHGTSAALPQDLRDRAKRSLLGWRYWIDEPGKDGLVFWSENHVLMFAAAEYLAGHLYPQDVFGNSGLTGAEHARKALPRLERWFARACATASASGTRPSTTRTTWRRC